MRGKNKVFIGLIGLLIAMVWVGTASAIEYGNFQVSGWVRNQIAYNVGHANPFNYNGEMADGERERCNLKLFSTQVQLKPQYKFTDSVSMFARFYASIDTAADTDYPIDVDKYPKSYDADMYLTGDDWLVGVKELYADFDSEYVWLRLGKQQVAWGQSDGLRLLDIVNPLDKSQHGISLNEPFLDGFDNTRESLWMTRLTLKSPWETENLNDLQLELLWLPGDAIGSQFVGHINPEKGSPYNFVGDMLTIEEEYPTGSEYGARLMGKYRGLEWSLNYFHGYTDDAIGLFKGVGMDPDLGFQVYLRGYHPEVDTYGFSLTYDENRFTKSVYRLEFIYYDKPFEDGTVGGTDIARRGTVSGLLGIDRPTIIPWLNRTRAFNLGFQCYVLQVVEDPSDVEDDLLKSNGTLITDNVTMVSFSATTGYMQDRINPQVLYIYDTGRKGHYFQGGVEFRFTDNILWWVGATLYDGKNGPGENGNLDSGNSAAGGYDDFAYFEWADEIQSRITFQF